MTENDTNFDKFIRQASALLAVNEANLKQLATETQAQLATMQAEQANGHHPSVEDLHYLQNQTHILTRQNQSLKAFLENDPQALPANLPLSRIEVLQQQEEERVRIAKELEDSTGQLLANAIFELAAIKTIISSEKDYDEMLNGIDALQQELEAGLGSLRFLVADLEPSATLGSFGLFAGLRRYLEKFSEQTGIEAQYETHTVIEQLPDMVEVAIFRIVQEALQNIRYHAKASQVRVVINEENNLLQFHIIDNGIGLQNKQIRQNQRRLGLVGMKDLTDMLEGQLHIKSDEDKGTQVILTIPYPQL